MGGFRPFSPCLFPAKSLCSMIMCKLLLLSWTAGFVLLESEQGAIATASTTVNKKEERAGEVLADLSTHTPCPPIRPDCDRNTVIDIGNSLPDDFIVSKQTPYRTGRNEILITSPSTGTEQRFEINLPDTGSFQLYKASFNKVNVSNPEKILGAGASLSPQQVAAKLQRFEIKFEQNAPKTVVLADGTRGEFSASGVVIRSKDGRVIETVKTSAIRKMQSQLMAALPVGSGAMVAQGSSGGSCQSTIRNELYQMSQKVQQKGADILKQKATSEDAKLIAWVTTFSQQALEDSLIADNRNQTLQNVACAKPVQCNQPRNYKGKWETRTDLFKLPGGNNKISLRYQFYQIPDSIELWREGKLIRKIGPKSGTATLPIEDTALHGTGYVGVKVIGHPTNKGTRWNYTISCSSKPPCNDDEIQISYDKAHNRYHDYTVDNLVCTVEQNGCTRQSVFDKMISQVNFIAPTSDTEPVTNCKITDLNIIPTSGDDSIRTTIDKTSYSITNHTRKNHMLHPGIVKRTIVQRGKSIFVVTFGEGTGPFRHINKWKAKGLWGDVDKKLIEAMKNK